MPIPWRFPEGVVLGESGCRLQCITRSVTSEEIYALNTSPKTLVPGVDGKIYAPVWVMLHYRFGTAAYAPADGNTLAVGVGDNIVTMADTFLAGTEDKHTFLDLAGGGGVINSADLIGEPMTISILEADPTDNGGDGLLDVTVLYIEYDAEGA